MPKLNWKAEKANNTPILQTSCPTKRESEGVKEKVGQQTRSTQRYIKRDTERDHATNEKQGRIKIFRREGFHPPGGGWGEGGCPLKLTNFFNLEIVNVASPGANTVHNQHPQVRGSGTSGIPPHSSPRRIRPLTMVSLTNLNL
ncbi:hypothetical protein PoB_000473000 [Plakobranchus ocellatus]|uniref:Uncharacterized protein n=1 Tax=Plakobranchus ocellatus TaxID=259542 RepID=A0AAV3Y611_9GAST|nr:hypothetical protein PoB_000473000 [Plakobranchus ocellatus]